jgi:formylglycine-generating enzyme
MNVAADPRASAVPDGTPVGPPGMVLLDGGTFRMGSDAHYPEEAPVHRVAVDAFWIDATPVTNAAFAAFVAATGHVTLAEIAPEPVDTSTCHVGFRCVMRPAGSGEST